MPALQIRTRNSTALEARRHAEGRSRKEIETVEGLFETTVWNESKNVWISNGWQNESSAWFTRRRSDEFYRFASLHFGPRVPRKWVPTLEWSAYALEAEFLCESPP